MFWVHNNLYFSSRKFHDNIMSLFDIVWRFYDTKYVLLICVLDRRVNGKNNESRHLLLMM
jgi:hypothetical protein